MAFNGRDVTQLLVKCHRRCCICHRFCGVKIELDHVLPKADGGDDSIENAIAVCFECHAEIHSYNDKHPRGRKFRPEELLQHRDQWLTLCSEKPAVLISGAWDGDVGPLQALVDELEFNAVVVKRSSSATRGALFQEAQFLRAVQEGMIAILDDALKSSILEAYAAMSRANRHIVAEANQGFRDQAQGQTTMKADEAIKAAAPLIDSAYNQLVGFLTAPD
jgi:hypothetical protein